MSPIRASKFPPVFESYDDSGLSDDAPGLDSYSDSSDAGFTSDEDAQIDVDYASSSKRGNPTLKKPTSSISSLTSRLLSRNATTRPESTRHSKNGSRPVSTRKGFTKLPIPSFHEQGNLYSRWPAGQEESLRQQFYNRYPTYAAQGETDVSLSGRIARDYPSINDSFRNSDRGSKRTRELGTQSFKSVAMTKLNAPFRRAKTEKRSAMREMENGSDNDDDDESIAKFGDYQYNVW